ncbi:protein DpdG [Nostoc sp.]|uniref:protein DpdG n=1 Tax=Nostoc sp. TaxID=1180 RepID=UPI002FFD14C4
MRYPGKSGKQSGRFGCTFNCCFEVEGKERRKGIRDRIRAGTQRIIFTSPESLMDSLASALYEAAKLGILRYFIIDEAHMVEQWGDDFRPAFQEIPGLRRDLLRLNSFTTLLLTATLTESCLDTLETLFGKDLQVISAVQLRPEPAYWFKRCESEEVRKQRLLEAVYHDWMRYLGFAWGHTLGVSGEKLVKVTVPDPTAYIQRNLKLLFNGQQEITIQDFINRLAKQCPLFETGKFREEVEAQIGTRETNFLSTSTAFALFRLHDEGEIQLEGKSDATLMILPKVNDKVDNDGRISHIIWKGENS